ncbi:integrase [Alsobacter metallidurans]|uniref:Integrase n=1 Tax=Alsobacter metallidurans TaxID=340221 RepID=A0A917MKL5_9HYPH|nr:site-specific integrase [Alsobacter metallidurans]GGH24515.1 integrase [Alsobacter metallidurans]
MARAINKLSARTAATVTKPGRHSDGGGLYLVVDPSGAKRWAFLFRWEGKLKELGLGGIVTVSLAEAREKASDARRLVASGINPIEAKRTSSAAAKHPTTFGGFADQLLADITPGFRNAKHRQQWTNTLQTYAAPLRDKRLDSIQTDHVLEVLKPLWLTKHETASRLRGRIERVLDAARAKGLRTGENPARWRGHLENLLPKRQRLTRGHHAALPYTDVPAFMVELRARDGMAARALELCILCASRSGEVLGAEWSEIDLKARIWTIPGTRMKAGKEHRVPLTDAALAVLSTVIQARTSTTADFVFPGLRAGRPLSVMAMEMVLRRMKRDEITVHGFRSSFRDWCGEATSFPREIAEAALAHQVGDATERAYRRGDALERRRGLLQAWAGYLCETSSEQVVPPRPTILA